MLYFIQRCLIQKLFQKRFFKQKITLVVLGKLKFYIITFADYKPFQINKFKKIGLFSFRDNWSIFDEAVEVPSFIKFFIDSIPGL